MKGKYKYIFVVLTFKNGEDLFTFDKSIKANLLSNYHVIVVNSYYDDESLNRINDISQHLGYDFISADNRGYGAGNNIGINYAIAKYEFDYLIVSNSDIEVMKFDDSCLDNKCIYGPLISTKTRKQQNPYFAMDNFVSEYLIYNAFNYNSRVLMILGQGINKVIREMYLLAFNLLKFTKSSAYALHGSFVIFPYIILERILPVYDESMFLYYEEAYLARKMKSMHIGMKVVRDIRILHYEDGSTAGSSIDLNKYFKDSFTYYYEKYRRKLGKNNG